MKKILSFLLASAIILSVFTGCVTFVRKQSVNAIKKSYSDSSYYEREQKEIDALVDEYTQKIEEAKDKDEIKQLEAEAIEKIGAIYSKDKIDAVKSDAEEALKLVKGKILPYQDLRKCITNVKDLIDTENYAELEEAVAEFKNLLDSASDKKVYHCQYDSVTFDMEASFALEDNSPVVTLSFPDELSKLGLNSGNNEVMQVSMSTICNSSALNPQVDKMLSYVAIIFTDEFTAYCGEDAKFTVETPDKARCEVDGNTYKFNLCSPEQKETLYSGSATYINSDGLEVNRDSGDDSPVDYVTFMIFDPSNWDDVGNTLADNLTWILIL